MEVLVAAIGIIILIWCLQLEEQQRYKKNKVIGDIGEGIVSKKLKQLNNNFVVKNNVHIDNCQIDHLVICHEYRVVFVIETKMWGGVISGTSSETMWKQNKNGVIRYFENPILQNRYHCNVVRRNYDGYKILSVVVFINNKNVPSSRCIVNSNELVGYINRVYNKLYNGCIIDV